MNEGDVTRINLHFYDIERIFKDLGNDFDIMVVGTLTFMERPGYFIFMFL